MNSSTLVHDLHRNQARFAVLHRRFQQSRATYADLAARVWHTDRLRLPVYTFVRTSDGPLRMVEHPSVAGGSGRGAAPLYCWMEAIPEAVVLHVEGEVDLATAPLFANAIAGAFLWGPRVIIDVAAVTYIDGSGLGILKNAAEANVARLVITGMTPQVRRLFDIVELTSAVPVALTLEAGRAYLRQAC